MLPDSVRQRLEALNRAPLPEGHWQKAPAPKAKKSAAATAERTTAILPPVRPAEGEVVENASGRHLRMRVPVAQLWKEAEERIAAGQARLVQKLGEADQPHPELAAFAAAFPRGTLFLDLETCGFAGSAIFLVGLLRRTDEGLVVEQLLARNYAEERAMLETLWETAAAHQVLATFNGKSFDWPMVHDRSTLHHLGHDGRTARRSRQPAAPQTRMPGMPLGPRDARPQLLHLDLLHHARRRWSGRLPNCKLQTLEHYLCGRRRVEDITGSRIPDAYHEYVRTGRQDEMQQILHHNLLDLVTLLEISLKVAG